MFRGEFVLGDGTVIPNNITTAGAQAILASALRDDDSLTLWVGLCDCVPDPGLQIEDVNEPTLDTNGYARVQITRDLTGWPTIGTVNGEPYAESGWIIFAASGGNFDKAIRRMFICEDEDATTGDVIALSTPLPAAITITPTTPEANRKFKYRIYSR